MSIETLLEEVGPDGLREAVERVLSDKVKEAPAKPEPNKAIIKKHTIEIRQITKEMETRFTTLVSILYSAHAEMLELAELGQKARELASYAPDKLSAWESNEIAMVIGSLFGKLHNGLLALEFTEADKYRKLAKCRRVQPGYDK